MWWFKEIVHVWHADHILGNSDPSAYNNEYQRLQILLKPPTPIFPFFLSLLRVFIASSQESVETAWEMFRAVIPALGQDPDGFYISSLISEVGRPCAALRYEGVSESNRHASSNKGEKKMIETKRNRALSRACLLLWPQHALGKNVVTTFGTTHLPTSQEDIKHPFGMCTVSALPITSYRCGERNPTQDLTNHRHQQHHEQPCFSFYFWLRWAWTVSFLALKTTEPQKKTEK